VIRRNYQDPIYENWRLRVYKRDKFTCQMPSCGYKKFLQAHHIRRWSSASILRYDPNNGITLCRNCHKKVTGNEQYYESLFVEIVRKKNG
jgi:5-methylcytosine-specific restriction endonuclease McrA